jgi:signal transduction histidine kinase
VATVSHHARSRDIAVTTDVQPDVPLMRGDPNRLEQVVVGLLSNAVKFTPDGGSVHLRASVSGGELLVAVSDTGIGILPEQLGRIFEEFHQGTRAIPEHAQGGTGLGLALARGLVELHGGRISVESVPDAGSTFTLVLPLSAVPALSSQEAT